MKKQATKKVARKRVVTRDKVRVETHTQIGKDSPSISAVETEFTGDLPEHPGRVRIGGGLTKSTGEPYEFVRVDVFVEVPCVPTGEGYRSAGKHASDLVEELIHAELDRAFGEG